MEKKQTNKMSYSTSGKRFRGLLCMITFCAFVAGMVFSICGIANFGTEIIYSSEKDYFDSIAYQVDISNEVTRLLTDLEQVYVSGMEDSFSITNVSDGSIYYYDLKGIIDDYKKGRTTPASLTDLEPYIQKTAKLQQYDFYDCSQALQYLKSSYVKNNYLYINEKAFQRFFTEMGILNDNYRFSKEFSESAYFLFADNRMLGEANTELSEEQEFEDSTEITIEEAGDTNNYAVNIILGDGEYGFTEGDYAVYDPETNLFYSTRDDYFEPSNNYVYNTEEVAGWGETISADNTDSIIFPLLLSMNYGMNGIWENIYDRYSATSQALAQLSEYDDSGLFYYIKNSGFEQSNVENIARITAQTYAYEMKGKSVAFSDDRVTLKNAADLQVYQPMEDAFSNFPDDTQFYFAINTSMNNQEDVSEVVSNSREYKWYATGIKYFAALAIVMFILIVIQAVWLLRTTGRRNKDDKEVYLNQFDRLPTELWLIIYAVFLILCGNAVVMTGNMVLREADTGFNISRLTGQVIGIALPFAFLFMVLALSLARRIKAHNFWSRLYLRKFYDAFRSFYYKREGTERFLAVFTVYEIVGGICTLMLFGSGRFIGFVVLIALQIAAGSVVFYMVKDIKHLIQSVRKITEGDLDYKVAVNEKFSVFKELGDGINHIGDGLKAAVETSLKDERMKTELITNVSHDLKTPLTSIINYINLLKTEKMPTDEAEHYVEVLDAKAQRLKQLTEDLVEAAKVNTGNIELEKIPLAFDELMKQAIGEFEDKFAARNLTVIAKYPEKPAVILADGRRMFRIIENILQNAYKYALEGTRIYADLSNEQSVITFILKNISAAPLNISPDELMERFTRGDSSRTTEGSGLGLSIAKDLTKLQDGSFDIQLDGDLFKVIITFPEYQKPEVEEADE